MSRPWHSDGMGWKPGALGRLERVIGLLGGDAGRDRLGKVINPGFQPPALRENPGLSPVIEIRCL